MTHYNILIACRARGKNISSSLPPGAEVIHYGLHVHQHGIMNAHLYTIYRILYDIFIHTYTNTYIILYQINCVYFGKLYEDCYDHIRVYTFNIYIYSTSIYYCMQLYHMYTVLIYKLYKGFTRKLCSKRVYTIHIHICIIGITYIQYIYIILIQHFT